MQPYLIMLFRNILLFNLALLVFRMKKRMC